MRTILIADDSRFMRNYLKNMVQQKYHLTVIEASDGQEVIDTYNLIKPDFVILDITMPKVSGLTALKKIKEFDTHAKVIMCSSLGTKSNVKQALQLGAIDFIVKPNFSNLLAILENHIIHKD